MANDLRMRTAKLELPGGRALHVALTFDDDGGPADLVLGAGYASDNALKVLSEGVNVPASVMPALRDALSTLQADEDAASGPSSVTDGSEAG